MPTNGTNFNMTTYYAKRIIGDSAAYQASSALLQTGAVPQSMNPWNTWIFSDNSKTTADYPYGIFHHRGDPSGNSYNNINTLEFYGGQKSGLNEEILAGWFKMDTGDMFVLGKLGLGYDPNSNNNTYQLYVTGTSYFNDDATFHDDVEFDSDVLISGNLLFPNETTKSEIQWNVGNEKQKIVVTDDSTNDTTVFSFQQATNNSSNFKELFIIKDNAKIVIPLISGYLYKTYTEASTTPAIVIGSKGLDVNILRVYDYDSAYADTGKYGFNLRYLGTGSGIDNQLAIYADNQTGNEVRALSINQAGQIGIKAAANSNYDLYVNGNSYFTSTAYFGNGTTYYISADGTQYTGSAAKWTNARTLTIGETGKSVDGSTDVSWSKDEILGSSTSAYFLRGDKTWSNTLIGQLYINYEQDVGKDQNGSLIIGNKVGENIGIDSNEIMARNNSAVSTLYLNSEGGTVQSGGTYYSTASPGFNNAVSSGSWSYLRLHNGSNFWDIATKSDHGSGALELRIGGGDTGYYFNTGDMPEGAANLSASAAQHSIKFYRNGLSIPYQMNDANDGGIFRVRGTSESTCICEIGTWDDSGAGETIQFNYYPTTSQITPTYSVTVPKETGTIFLRRPWWTSGNGNNSNDLRHGCVFAYTNHNCPTNGTLVAFDCSGNENYTLQLQGTYSGSGLYYRNRNGDNGTWGSWYQVVHNSGSWSISVTGSSGSCTGNAATATALTSNAGNANTPIYFSGGKPVATNNKLGAVNANGYWGMRGADNGDGWIRTTSSGIIPVQSGGAGSGHCGLGTSSWYFSYVYADNFYGKFNGNCTGSSGSCTGNAATATYAKYMSTDYVSGRTSNASNPFNTLVSDYGSANRVLQNYPSGMSYGSVFTIACAGGYNNSLSAQFAWDVRHSTTYAGLLWFRTNGTGGNTGNNWKSWTRVWLQGDAVTGAVWNDYAEHREVRNAEPGRLVYELGDDTLIQTEERLQHFAGIVSDTWGFSQGETERAKTPIAVAGRVLAYPFRPREEYHPGDVLCAAPNGTVDIMTREEIHKYPDRIVGTVSCVPLYEEWGTFETPNRTPVKINGRIWVKVH